MYSDTDEKEVNLCFSSSGCKEDELWWNVQPLTNLDLSSNVLCEIPSEIGMFQDLTVLNVRFVPVVVWCKPERFL